MRRHLSRIWRTGAFVASLVLAVTAFPQSSAAQTGPESLVGLRLHAERNNTTDGRVAGPVNFAIDTTIDSVNRDMISLTIDSRVTRVGGSLALRMVTHVDAPLAQVIVIRGGNPPTLISFQCKDNSECIAWSILSYFNDDPKAVAPTGGMERQSTLTTTDLSASDRIYAVVCTLAECKN